MLKASILFKPTVSIRLLLVLYQVCSALLIPVITSRRPQTTTAEYAGRAHNQDQEQQAKSYSIAIG